MIVLVQNGLEYIELWILSDKKFSLMLLIALSFLESKGEVVVGTNISLSESNVGWPPEARREFGNVSLRVLRDPQATSLRYCVDQDPRQLLRVRAEEQR